MNSDENSYSVNPDIYIRVLNEQCDSYRQQCTQLTALVQQLSQENQELADALTKARASGADEHLSTAGYSD